MIYKCTKCSKDYDYKRGRSGASTKHCASCVVNRRRFRIKKRSIEFLGGKCVKCGYNKSNRALQFHHLNPEEKEFNISGSHCRSWTKIELELKKCILVCANCHAEIEEHKTGR